MQLPVENEKEKFKKKSKKKEDPNFVFLYFKLFGRAFCAHTDCLQQMTNFMFYIFITTDVGFPFRTTEKKKKENYMCETNKEMW